GGSLPSDRRSPRPWQTNQAVPPRTLSRTRGQSTAPEYDRSTRSRSPGFPLGGAIDWEQTVLPSPGNRFDPRASADFLEQVACVELDRLDRHPELVGNLAVAAATGHQPQHFFLASGERLQLGPTRTIDDGA